MSGDALTNNKQKARLEEKQNGSVSFEEAEVTLVCKKLFKQCLEKENMVPEVAKQFYDGDALHDMYIGEVVDIIK